MNAGQQPAGVRLVQALVVRVSDEHAQFTETVVDARPHGVVVFVAERLHQLQHLHSGGLASLNLADQKN